MPGGNKKTNSTEFRWVRAEDEPDTLFGDDWGTDRHLGKGEYSGMEFFHVNAKRIINKVSSASQVPFSYTINAYRGCSHACVYCFARPTHRYLNLGIGDDFDRKIVVKINAVERLKAEFRSKSWTTSPIAMGTNTDPYQKAEGKYHLTRRIIQTLLDARNPFSILTKSTLVLRDLHLLVEAAHAMPIFMNFSVGTLDRNVWQATEPGTPPPEKRIEAVKKLNDAGVPCGVLIAPILPKLSDSEHQLRQVVDASVKAGAVSITPISLHLRGEVRGHYLNWINDHHPELIPEYMQLFRNSSYLPRGERNEVTSMVRKMVREAKMTRPKQILASDRIKKGSL